MDDCGWCVNSFWNVENIEAGTILIPTILSDPNSLEPMIPYSRVPLDISKKNTLTKTNKTVFLSLSNIFWRWGPHFLAHQGTTHPRQQLCAWGVQPPLPQWKVSPKLFPPGIAFQWIAWNCHDVQVLLHSPRLSPVAIGLLWVLFWVDQNLNHCQ